MLLNPAVTSRAGGVQDAEGDLAQRYRARAKRAWGRFKLAAVSSFAFVEAMGPVYIGKLVRDGLGVEVLLLRSLGSAASCHRCRSCLPIVGSISPRSSATH